MIEDKEILQLIWEHRNAEVDLALAKTKELNLRNRVFAACFPTPKEGANTVDLPENWKLTGTHKINRSIDEPAMAAVFVQLRAVDVNPDPLVKHKPELVTSAYKALTDANRAIFDQCLVIKPGTPALELKAPKEKKEK